MSNLEDKAKYAYEIQEALELAECHDNSDTYTLMSRVQWVKLVVAQKEISENKAEFERNNVFAYKQILELEAKIEVANKILSEFRLELFNTGAAKIDGSDYYSFDIDETIKQLKVALQIPRSQEQKEAKTIE